jgi:hypothetical protein
LKDASWPAGRIESTFTNRSTNLLFCPIMQAAGAMERKVAMTRSLPPKPSLRFLKEEAKDLLKAQRRKDPSASAVLRLLRRFRDARDENILAADVALHEAQFALAMDYGFSSWDALVQEVRSVGEAVVFQEQRAAGVGFQGDRLRQDTFSLAVTCRLPHRAPLLEQRLCSRHSP